MICNKARISAVLTHLCGQIFALLACSFSASATEEDSALRYRISAPGWVASAIQDDDPVLNGTYVLDDNKELEFSSGGITDGLPNLKDYIKKHTGSSINLTVKPIAIMCTIGKYKSSSGCVDCPIGTYGGGGHSTECTPCPDGLTTLGIGTEDENGCIIENTCVAGEYLSEDGCKLCAAGTYMDEIGHSNTACKPADKGYFVSEAGATTQTRCGEGSYTDTTGQTGCKACNAGYTTYVEENPNATTSVRECVPCGNNSSGVAAYMSPVWNANNTVTNLCEIDQCGSEYEKKYSEIYGYYECSKTCEPGYYMNDAYCSPCLAGTYSDTENAQECKPCTNAIDDKHIYYYGIATSSENCTWYCGAGYFLPSGAQTCQTCQRGYSCIGNNLIQKCTSAPENAEYTDAYGSTTPPQYCAWQCKEGYSETADKKCEAVGCPNGKYYNNSGTCVSINTTTNGTDSGYYSLDGGATFNTYKYQLNSKGTWGVTFSYDTLKGEATCNSVNKINTTDSSEMLKQYPATDQEFTIGVTGKYCWCRVTSPNQSKWIQASLTYYGDDHQATCKDGCANRCALAVKNYKEMRDAIYTNLVN